MSIRAITPFWSLTSVALVAAMTIGCEQAFDYRVVHAGDGQITVSDDQAMGEVTHDVSPDAEITLDGESVDLAQLNPGDTVALTTEEFDEIELVTEIKATSTSAYRDQSSDPMDSSSPAEIETKTDAGPTTTESEDGNEEEATTPAVDASGPGDSTVPEAS